MSAVVKVFNKTVDTVTDVVKKVADTVVDTVKAVIDDPLPTILSLAGQAVGIPAPITMAAITGARGGDLGDMAKAAAITYVAGKVTPQISKVIDPSVQSIISNPAVATAVTNAVSQGLVSGSVAAIQGGDFGKGFAGGAAGSAVASGMQQIITPSVLQTAKNFGLTNETGQFISNALSAGVATGAAAVAVGGDFGKGFESGIVNTGVNYVTAKAENVLKDAYDSVFGDKSLTTSISRATTASNKLDEMLASDKLADMVANDRPTDTIDNDAAFNQILDVFNKPISEGVGTQIGDPLAATGTFLPGQVSDANSVVRDEDLPDVGLKPTLGLPEVTVEDKTYATESDFLDDLKKAAISGNTNLLTDATQIGKLPTAEETTVPSDTTTKLLNPEVDFGNYQVPPVELQVIADEANQKATELNDAHDALLAEINNYTNLPNKTPEQTAAIESKVKAYNDTHAAVSGEVSNLQQTYDSIKEKLLEGQTVEQPVVDTTIGEAKPETSVTGTTAPVDYQKTATDAYKNYINAQIIAATTNTPEANITAAQAKLDAELAQRIADEQAAGGGIGEPLPTNDGTLPSNPNAPNYQIGEEGPANIGNQDAGLPQNTDIGGLPSTGGGTTTGGGLATATPPVVPPVIPPIGDGVGGGGGGTRPVQSGLTSQTVTYNKPQPYFENPSFTLFPVTPVRAAPDPFGRYFKIGGLAAIRRK